MASNVTRAIPGSYQSAYLKGNKCLGQGEQSAQCAFEQVIELHQKRITQLIYRLLGWQEKDVEDVVQEVFMAAFANWKKFRGRSDVGTWLTRITINKCRSWQRKHLLGRKLLKIVQTSTTIGPLENTPDGELMDSETFERVRRAVGQLPGRLREVVVLRYLEEMPIMEVAQGLEISTNAVNTRLSRAREQLKDKLADIFAL